MKRVGLPKTEATAMSSLAATSSPLATTGLRVIKLIEKMVSKI